MKDRIELAGAEKRPEVERTMEPDEILTTDEVAALLKINPKTVYKFLKANAIHGHRFGRIWRFKKSSIMKLLEKPDSSQ
jgi:excisionase family DNA binding protein